MKTHSEVYNSIIEAIKKEIPTYRFSDITYQILGSNFDLVTNPNNIGDEIANKIVTSLVRRIKEKDVNGKLNSFEENIFLNDKKIWKWKGSASLGKGEYWTALIMNWDFAKSAGCDLIDTNRTTYDVKAVRGLKSNAGIPCTFFVQGIPIKKSHGCVFFNGELIYRYNSNYFVPMMNLIRRITSCQIPYTKLDKYFFYYYNQENKILTSAIKDREVVEQDINNRLQTVQESRVRLTESKWMDGCYNYTFEEFKEII